MEVVLERLRNLRFFSELTEETRREIAELGSWRSVAGGWCLFDQGAPAEGLFIVVSGRLVVVREDRQQSDGPDGPVEEVVGYVRAGEPLGEMALMSGGAHSATAYALRDTEVLAIDPASFERLFRERADFAGALARISLARARQPALTHRRSAPRVFALIATSPSIDIDAHARALAREVSALGIKTGCARVSETAPESLAFDREEEAKDVLILAARVTDSPWFRFVLRHSDRFLVLARRDARPPRPFPLVTAAGERARRFRLVDLVMLREGAPSASVADWADAVSASRIFHLRSDGCLRRLARIIAGRSVGLVLSGGGARAYAHIGVVRAMQERGVEPDFLCGASMGAIVGACVAMGWGLEEIERRVRDAFVSSNPLGDHVLPVVALTRGRLVEERLATHFGDTRIEDMPLPFFCVSSELTAGRLHLHRRGLLKDALRATISLPGILPPVAHGGTLLVDGAVINNFPTDIMARVHRGPTIGVDVAMRGTIDPAAFVDPPSFFGWVRRHGLRSAPPIVSLLMRAATARHEDAAGAEAADILITPAVPGVELRDWKKYDVAVEDGYRAAIAALDAATDVLAPSKVHEEVPAWTTEVHAAHK